MIQRSVVPASVVATAFAPALLMKLPPAARTICPPACVLVIAVPALSVMLPPVRMVVLSANASPPPKVTLPAVALPIVMFAKPFLNTPVPLLNNVAGKDKVPAPPAMPMVVLLVAGRNVRLPDDAMASLVLNVIALAISSMLDDDAVTVELACWPSVIVVLGSTTMLAPPLIVIGPVLASAAKVATLFKNPKYVPTLPVVVVPDKLMPPPLVASSLVGPVRMPTPLFAVPLMTMASVAVLVD